MKNTGLLILILLLVVGCSQDQSEPASASARPALTLSTEEVEPQTVTLSVDLMGIVEARTVAMIAPRIMAQIESDLVQVGDKVAAKQVLFRLDTRELRARLHAAEAARNQAQAAILEATEGLAAARASLASADAQAQLAETTLQRFGVLRERDSVSAQEFDEVKSRRDAALAQVSRAQASVRSLEARRAQAESGDRRAQAEIEQIHTLLSYAQIQAPFPGWVTEKMAQVGDLATPGVPLLKLESDRGFRIALEVPESQIETLKLGQTCPVQVPALQKTLVGTVSEIQPGSGRGHTFRVKLDLPPEPGLRSGLFARASLPTGQETLVAVPGSAIVRRGQLDGVFVLGEQGRARYRLVELGRDLGDRIEVVSGLAAGERFVASPSADLRDGTPVQE